MRVEEPPTTKTQTCKECGELYIPSKTNRKGKPVDSNGKFIEDACRDCKIE
jgi:RNase P subunit RPR2